MSSIYLTYRCKYYAWHTSLITTINLSLLATMHLHGSCLNISKSQKSCHTLPYWLWPSLVQSRLQWYPCQVRCTGVVILHLIGDDITISSQAKPYPSPRLNLDVSFAWKTFKIIQNLTGFSSSEGVFLVFTCKHLPPSNARRISW